jgi:hypothetical protein
MQLFTIVFGSYGLSFLLVALALGSERYGLVGGEGDVRPSSPRRLVGWFLYFAIESYGSLSTSMFWQVTLPLILTVGQFGRSGLSVGLVSRSVGRLAGWLVGRSVGLVG